MTIEEMKENGAKHWKQQALIQVLRSEAEEGFKRITSYPIHDKELYTKAYFDAAEPREERIAELEKENGELKKSIKYMNTICERKSVTNSQLTELAADSSAKLCEAKGILKRLLEEEKNNMYWEMDGSDKSPYYKVRKEAEQFLKEVDK